MMRSDDWKLFFKDSLQNQVLDIATEISKFKEEKEKEPELVIPKKPKEGKPKKKKKKKTINDINREAKKLIQENKTEEALSLLTKSLQDEYAHSKRLASLRATLLEEDVSTTRNLWNREEYKQVVSSNKPQEESENILPEESSEDIIPETQEEKIEMIDVPDLPLDDLEEAIAPEPEEESVQDESGGSVVFGMIGAGQAGGRLVESFYGAGSKKALAVNTATHDLAGLVNLPENQKIHMAGAGTGGAGKDMRLGEQAADKSQQEIYEKMQKVFGDVDRILVCAGAGGGTGGGSCLRLVETAKKYLTYLGVENVNRKVGVLLTLPTAGEAASPTVADNAHLIASKLTGLADGGDISPLLIFDNDKIKKMYPKLTVKKFWPTVNATVTGLFHMFNVLSTKVGCPTSFDPADYQRVLSAGGCMIMGFTTLKKYADGTDVSQAVRSNLEKGLLCGGFDMSTAKSAACIATASDAILDSTPGLMDSLETGFDTLANITGNASVFRGIYEVEKDRLVIYTMITGLSAPTKRLGDLKRFQNQTATTKTKLYD